MTDVGDDGGGICPNGESIGKENVLVDEDIFRLATDSSPWAQNDNGDGERLGDPEDLAELWGLSTWAQILRHGLRMTTRGAMTSLWDVSPMTDVGDDAGTDGRILFK